MVLLGFSVLGSPVFTPLKSSEMRDAVEKLEKERFENRCSDGTLKETPWISSFLGRGGQMEHEAFLVLWLSLFVFPATSRRALAPVVLSILYRDLGRICDFGREKCADKVNLKSLLKLVQVWTWERFRNIRPKAREIPKDLKNWKPLRFYVEEAMWVTVDESIDDEFAYFARCVRVSQLAGNGFVKDYFPNRVAMQFGLAQDLPGLVTRHRIFTEKEAWGEYSKSFDGLKLYMPSRLDRGSVTSRYRVWWRKSVSKFLGSAEMHKESTETFNARKKVEHYDEDVDDIDTSPKVLPLSHVVQRLKEGFSAKHRRSVMHRSVKQDKIGGLVNSSVSSGWKMNKAKVDKLTFAQRIRSWKKYSSDAERTGGDTSERQGKRARRYMAVDSDDDLEPCQKHASIKIEQMKKKSMMDDKPRNGSIMQSIGSNGAKKAECLVHEDGEKHKCNEKLCSEVKKEEEIDERLKQRKLAIKEMELKLEARIIEMEKTLAMIRKWKTRGNMTGNGVSSV
ncbi:unnamed protein product [Arabidopsis lyrata]|nr:unnamed protein product [Arabidopsis lyrata]